MAQRADYTYTFKSFQENRFVVIIDLDQGHTSVTNDIENVIEEITANNPSIDDSWRWIYFDTNGSYDGWNPQTKQFVFLSRETPKEAMETYIAFDQNKEPLEIKSNFNQPYFFNK